MPSLFTYYRFKYNLAVEKCEKRTKEKPKRVEGNLRFVLYISVCLDRHYLINYFQYL